MMIELSINQSAPDEVGCRLEVGSPKPTFSIDAIHLNFLQKIFYKTSQPIFSKYLILSF